MTFRQEEYDCLTKMTDEAILANKSVIYIDDYDELMKLWRWTVKYTGWQPREAFMFNKVLFRHSKLMPDEDYVESLKAAGII